MFERWESLSEQLAEMAPGPDLALVLASVDRDRLSGYERVVLMQAWQRQVAHDQAEFFASMIAVTDAEAQELSPDSPHDLIYEMASAEIRAALTWTRRSADCQLSWASQLVEDYPTVWEALHQGLIDLPKPGSSSAKPVASIMISEPEWPRSHWNGPQSKPPVSWQRESASW